MSHSYTSVDLETAWTVIDGLRIFSRISPQIGDPNLPPFVFVHGLSVSSRYMVPTAKLLAAYRRVYLPDLPGFGESEDPSYVLDIPALAAALVRWMDYWHIEQPIMIGNSLGCQVIVDVAMRHPDRLRAAVLTGPTMDTQGRRFLEQARRLMIDSTRESLPCVVTQLGDYIRAGPQRTLATVRYALADPVERKLPMMHVPTLVVRGARDPIVPQRWIEEMMTLLPDAQLLVIPGGAHVVTYDHAEELTAAVLAFVAAHPHL